MAAQTDANANDTIQGLIAEINHSAAAFTSANLQVLDSDSSAASRKQLLAAARNLTAVLEDSEDDVWRFAFTPAVHSIALVAWQRNLLGPWPKGRMSATELADHTGIDAVLIGRMMRTMSQYNIFREVEEELYEHTPFSTKLSTPPWNIRAFRLGSKMRGISQLPEYLAKYGYENPGTNPANPSLFSYANNTELGFFEWMTSQPDTEELDGFNQAMARSMDSKRAAIVNVPVFQELVDTTSDEVAIVDVGGGYGHLLREIRHRLPQIKGRLVLEDLPETVKGAEWVTAEDNVGVQGYNFLQQEQPIKGSRLYILRHVLADWSDHSARIILKNTIPALVKGRSRILLVEIVLEPTSTANTAWGALMDIQMMRFGGMTRKIQQWRALVESAGLKIIKIWPEDVGGDRIMEVVPQDW